MARGDPCSGCGECCTNKKWLKIGKGCGQWNITWKEKGDAEHEHE